MGRRWCAPKWVAITAAVLSVVAGIVAFILPVRYESLSAEGVKSHTTLSPNNPEVLKAFSHRRQNLRIWTYNVTNAPDVLTGAKPEVQEVGPLTYAAITTLFNITFSPDGEFIKFSEWTRFVPTPETEALESQNVTSINIPFQAFAGDHLDALYVWDTFQKQTDLTRLFVNRPARDIVWGYHDDMLEWLHNHKTLNQWFDVPTWYSGLQTNFSSKDEAFLGLGASRMHTGARIEQLNRNVVAWDGMASLNCCLLGSCGPNDRGGFRQAAWQSEEANQFVGTFGFDFGAGVGKPSNLTVFVPELFRSVDVEYKGTTKTDKDMVLHRYSVPASVFQNAHTNKLNAPFYANGPNGLANVSSCRSNAQTFLSKRHFLDGEPALWKNLTNFPAPDPETDDDQVFVEPLTGLSLSRLQRWQWNTLVQPTPASLFNGTVVELFPNVRHTYFPLASAEMEYVMPPEEVARLHKKVYLPLARKSTAVRVAGGCALGFGVLAVVAMGVHVVLGWVRRAASELPEDMSSEYIQFDVDGGDDTDGVASGVSSSR